MSGCHTIHAADFDASRGITQLLQKQTLADNLPRTIVPYCPAPVLVNGKSTVNKWIDASLTQHFRQAQEIRVAALGRTGQTRTYKQVRH